MNNDRYDLYLLSRIIGASVKQLTVLFDYKDDQRFCSSDNIMGLADRFEVPELLADLNQFEGLNRQKSLILQHELKKKYAHIGQHLIDSETPSDTPKPSHYEELESGVAELPLTDSVNQAITKNFTEPLKKHVEVKPQKLGIVLWFNGDFGVIRDREEEVFLHRTQNPDLPGSLKEGEVVQFSPYLDRNKNRKSGRKSKVIRSLTDYGDKQGAIHTLHYYLFENPQNPEQLRQAFKHTIIPQESFDALLQFRLHQEFAIESTNSLISNWATVENGLSQAMLNAGDPLTVAQHCCDILLATRQKVSSRTNQPELHAELLDHCFWKPALTVAEELSDSVFIRYSINTFLLLKHHKIAFSEPDESYLIALRQRIDIWSSAFVFSDEESEKAVLTCLETAAPLLGLDLVVYRRRLRYTSDYQLTKWIKQPDVYEFPSAEQPEELAGFLDKVPSDKLMAALNYFSVSLLSSTYPFLREPLVKGAVAEYAFNWFFNDLKTVVFDLEVDETGNLRQGSFRFQDETVFIPIEEPGDADKYRHALQQAVERAAVVAGHNIRAFDLPIMTREGVKFGEITVWDTLEIEALLAPLSGSFALVTAHNALSDTITATDLFRNQVRRLLTNWLRFASLVVDLLPLSLVEKLASFYREFGSALGPASQQERSVFFHQEAPLPPQQVPSTSSLLRVAPRLTWPEWIRTPEVTFWSPVDEAAEEVDPYQSCLSPEKIHSVIQNPRIRAFLVSFVIACTESRICPTVINLPVWTRIQLQSEVSDEKALCHLHPRLPIQPQPGDVYVTDELGWLALSAEERSRWTIDHREPTLSAVTFRRLIGTIQLHERSKIFSQAGLWKRLAGGSRFAPLGRDELPMEFTVPPVLTNFWLEKTTPFTFSIWGNIVQPAVIAELLEQKDSEDKGQRAETDRCALKLIHHKEFGGLYGRLNPETPYRASYWTGQVFLLQRLKCTSPIIWLLPDDKELEKVQELLEATGFWCPPADRHLIRRLELLNTTHHRNRVLPLPLRLLPMVLSMQHWGPLTWVIDSLPVAEAAMMAGSIHDWTTAEQEMQDQEVDDAEEEDDEKKDPEDAKPTLQPALRYLDLDGSFLLIEPLIQYYRKRLFMNDPGHELLVLDARLNEQIGIANRWGGEKVSVDLWRTEIEYKALYDTLTKIFPHQAPLRLNLSNLMEVQGTIECVFLGQDEHGNWLRLRKNQQPYFDHIIQADGDLIVSLPTGGGKSVLFQGPALYRGFLSNRLTIVITPLRALMEDQVSKLEELGFFGSVEYINQQSDSIQNIYRRLAGGEITLLYVTPERFRSRSFTRALSMRLQQDNGLEYCVFDEAHCISQWGGEFRPDYLWVATLISRLKKANGDFPALFFSATISEQIYNDLSEIFA